MSEDGVYRKNVAMIILSNEYPTKIEIFVAQRNDLHNVWQFPQGGIDKGEDVQEAMFRELEEEIGTASVEIIGEFPKWISYDFPKKIAKKMAPYKGQIQKYFLLKLKKDVKINLDTEYPEFIDYKFVSVDNILSQAASFKKDTYATVINYFKKDGLL